MAKLLDTIRSSIAAAIAPAAIKNEVSVTWTDRIDPTLYAPAAVSVGNVFVSTESALKLEAVWACVRLISETISSLPLGIYQKTKTGKRYAPEHPTHGIIHDNPNQDTTASVMWQSFIAAMLLHGNGFCERLLIGSRLVGLRFLATSRLYISSDGAGNKRYFYTGDDGIQREIPASRIFRVPGFSIDGSWGVSSIYYGANVFGAAQSAETAAAKTFEKGLMPTVAISYPDTLKHSQREEMRGTIETLTGAANAGRPIVLENGMAATILGINPRDAQLLEARVHSRESICAWFRVPPWMIGFGEKSTAWGTGMEQQMIAFLQFVLAPWLVRIEQFINKQLLTPQDRAQGYYAKYSVEGLLRADSKSRAEFYDKMIKAAVMTPDQARELEEWDAIGGNAGKLIVNSATTLLETLGAQNEPETNQGSQPAEQPADRDQGGDSADGAGAV